MGRAWKLHDNVNTDEIIPGRYNVTTDRASLAEHCLCEVRPDFPTGVKAGDVVVGGRNFGCGSSREHAPIAFKPAAWPPSSPRPSRASSIATRSTLGCRYWSARNRQDSGW